MFLRNSYFVLLLLIGFNVFCQQKTKSDSITISGKVIDKETKDPLPFAGVMMIDSNNKQIYTITDLNGKFKLKINKTLELYQLKVTYVGWESFKGLFYLRDKEEKIIELKPGGIQIGIEQWPHVQPLIVSDTIKGQVVDKLTKEPIPFANVTIFDDTNLKDAISKTNVDGNFSIAVGEIQKYSLLVEYVGYKDYESSYDIDNSNNIKIELESYHEGGVYYNDPIVPLLDDSIKTYQISICKPHFYGDTATSNSEPLTNEIISKMKVLYSNVKGVMCNLNYDSLNHCYSFLPTKQDLQGGKITVKCPGFRNINYNVDKYDTFKNKYIKVIDLGKLFLIDEKKKYYIDGNIMRPYKIIENYFVVKFKTSYVTNHSHCTLRNIAMDFPDSTFVDLCKSLNLSIQYYSPNSKTTYNYACNNRDYSVTVLLKKSNAYVNKANGIDVLHTLRNFERIQSAGIILELNPVNWFYSCESVWIGERAVCHNIHVKHTNGYFQTNTPLNSSLLKKYNIEPIDINQSDNPDYFNYRYGLPFVYKLKNDKGVELVNVCNKLFETVSSKVPSFKIRMLQWDVD